MKLRLSLPLLLCLFLAPVHALESVPGWPREGVDLVEAMIPMPDGTRLAADLYLPAVRQPGDQFPVLLNYEPYRQRESRASNFATGAYLVERGYVLAFVDIRGTGHSQGRTIPYEYSDIELDDGEDVIAWLADQSWSTGKVGMWGISWSGFNAIQMAARNPPALKAFIAIMATEDLYREDVHYMDGIIHVDSWMLSHDLYNALPPSPGFEMDEEWLKNRFEAEPSVFTYMRQQRDGPFWDRASSLDKYARIKVPGYHIGGWYDGYRNSLPRMLEKVSAPVKAMIGPWDHYLPHNAWPGPPMEWRNEAVRWFDHWLKGKDTGIMEEPSFAVFVRDWHPPDPALESVPGRWRWEDGWPIERTEWQTWYAQAGQALAPAPSARATHSHRYAPSQGLEGGGPTMWWGSVTPDQQPHDDFSLVYETEPLEESLEILGFPLARLTVSSSATRANWVVRLSDVSPSGQVTQVAGAGANGTHRDSAREPRDLVPGQEFPLDVKLHFTSWVFPKGHRIRFSVSNSQWPMFWPSPYPMTTTLAIGGEGGARVELPVIPVGEWREPAFQSPADNPVLSGYETIDSGNVSGYAAITSVQRDPNSGEAVGVAPNSGAYRYPWGVQRYQERMEFRTSDDQPARTSLDGSYALTHELKDRVIRFEQDTRFESDLDQFILRVDRRAFLDGELLHRKVWEEAIPRDHQ